MTRCLWYHEVGTLDPLLKGPSPGPSWTPSSMDTPQKTTSKHTYMTTSFWCFCDIHLGWLLELCSIVSRHRVSSWKRFPLTWPNQSPGSSRCNRTEQQCWMASSPGKKRKSQVRSNGQWINVQFPAGRGRKVQKKIHEKRSKNISLGNSGQNEA